MNWEIWIDTGGTFTDCIGQREDGHVARCKVLSSSEVRSKVITSGDNWIKVDQSDVANNPLFEGYFHDDLQLQTVDQGTGTLYFDRQIPSNIGAQVHLTANEEAPILAARILSNTRLGEELPITEMRLGTTKGTNALLERKGCNTLFITNEGFKDLLEIGYQQRPDLFALEVIKRQQLYSAVVTAHVRQGADGKVLTDWTDQEIQRVLTLINDHKPDAVAIGFIHSSSDSTLETRLQKEVEAMGIHCTCSALISNEHKLIPRCESAVINAYLSPILDQYVKAIQRQLGNAELKIMTSAGHLAQANHFKAKDSLLSGPAGGVVGAGSIATLCNIPKVLTLDMGGTSTDVARYEGQPDFQYITKVGDAEMAAISIAVETVAAGGGSICWFDGYKLQVGPMSAGATPGPACYGAGGPLTVTDLNLLAGHADPEQFSIPIDRNAALKRLKEVQTQLLEQRFDPISEHELTQGFLQIANEKMAEAVRKISVSKGFNTSEYALLAFGGAGAQHACAVAEALAITKVIIPADGSLLSAFGIGHTSIREVQRVSVAIPLEQILNQRNKWVEQLSIWGQKSLIKQGVSVDQIIESTPTLFLRFKGQEQSLPIDWNEPKAVRRSFQKQYQALYGHWLENQTIECEAVQLILTQLPKNERAVNLNSASLWSLPPDDQISGPALITNPYTTIHVPAGWEACLLKDQVIINQRSEVKTSQDNTNTAIESELFANRFKSIAEEMGAMLQRTSFSVNVKERLDFSCAVLDGAGYLVVNAPHIPVHLGSLGLCVRKVQECLQLQDGDIAITNHPAFGGSHLPDVTLIAPVYDDETLIGFVANRAHHSEIGGKTPGSMPADATYLAEEGVVFPPLLLAKAGHFNWDQISDILHQGPYPSRAIAENLADLRGAVASINSGIVGLKALCQTYGPIHVTQQMNRIHQNAQLQMETIFERMDDGSYTATERLDNGSVLQLTASVKNNRARFDFNGTSAVQKDNLNANLAIVQSALMYFLRLLGPSNLPLNDGLLSAVDLQVPDSFIHPKFDPDPTRCPAVVGGNVEVSQRIVDTLLKAFELAGCSQGTMNNFLFGNDEFGYYETVCGGTGATANHPGADAVHQHMTNTRITDPELMERRYPVRILSFEIIANSGGSGRHSGGNGVRRAIEFLAPLTVTWLTQHRLTSPYGMRGGHSGKAGSQSILSKGTSTPLPWSGNRKVVEGDVFILNTPGGGGYGIPD